MLDVEIVGIQEYRNYSKPWRRGCEGRKLEHESLANVTTGLNINIKDNDAFQLIDSPFLGWRVDHRRSDT